MMPPAGPPPPSATSLLMARLVAGDARAFDALVRVLQGPALRLADRTLNDRAGAEDVVQQALTRLWSLADRFDPARGSVEGWFRRIVVNLCLDRRRAMRPVVPIDMIGEMPSDAPDPLANAIAADQNARLASAMAQLLPRQRVALALFHGDGLSMAEIADVLETTPKAVEGLLGRARMELKKLMGQTAP
ncbi:sigma-70 family RNA polymerase sigma factor [Polymorphobacter fuscus]|nr:sigma-70 family RNA polymerase sigma factor [Polymorphobacter fuscus]NJC09869.1 RNA polymerase sigma-70 factor (ECF subfamily) [Polymorphobacter fuscus]